MLIFGLFVGFAREKLFKLLVRNKIEFSQIIYLDDDWL